MFNQVPIPVWLLVAILAAAIAPARYVYKYITHSPANHDITQAPEDLSWRTSGQLVRDVAILAVLAAVAVFIFTEQAAQLAHVPIFWPALLVAFGAWALITVPRGLETDHIEPFVKGVYTAYQRKTQPKRFWLSVGWNAVLGAICLWSGFKGIEEAPAQAVRDQCYDFKIAPQKQLTSCNQLIGKRDKTGIELAGLENARGSAYYRLGDYPHASIDYTDAIRLDPSDSSSRFNRGLVDERLGDRTRAVVDYSEAIREQSDNADAYFHRGMIFLDTARFDQAVADFARVHELRPKDPWALGDRGISYAWMGDSERAEQDFASVRASDPANPILLRGEAVISIRAGDMNAAVDRLTVEIKAHPNDRWALWMRAQAYRRLGDLEKSRADENQLERLSKGAKVIQVMRP